MVYGLMHCDLCKLGPQCPMHVYMISSQDWYHFMFLETICQLREMSPLAQPLYIDHLLEPNMFLLRQMVFSLIDTGPETSLTADPVATIEADDLIMIATIEADDQNMIIGMPT